MASNSLGELAGHSNLGLPLPSKSLFRRFFARLFWPQVSHQVAANSLIVGELAQLRQRLDNFDEHSINVVAHLKALQKKADAVDAERDSVLERVELAKRQAFITHHEGVSAIRAELAELARLIDVHIADSSDLADFTDLVHTAVDTAVEERKTIELRFERSLAGIRIQLAQMNLFVDELKRSRPQAPSAERIEALPGAFDWLYPAFEDAFRGSEELIRDRVKTYIDDLSASEDHSPILDIGCGRGELLEVLQEAKIEAYGIDTNEEHVRSCQERGLDVRLIDALSHLQNVKPGSLGGITAIQLVEHIGIGDLIELIDRSVVALQPGGVLIFETPNPDNLTVGASTFYLDPTHERPLPPQLLAFLVGCRGLIDVEVRELHRNELAELPAPAAGEPWTKDLLPLVDALNTRLFSSQDYAIVARRP